MRTIRNTLAALLAAASLVSCTSAANSHAGSAPEPSFIRLTVTNQNWLDVTVYAVRGGSRYRIGNAGGNSSASLRIPANLVVSGAVQLLVDPIGSQEAYTTGAIMVSADESVQLNVAPRIPMSSYAVRTR